MSNNLNESEVISPTELDPVTGDNILTATYAGWESKPFAVEGIPHGADEINILFSFDFDGASVIEIQPQHATRDAPSVWYPSMKANADDEAVPDTIKLLPGNMLSDPGWADLAFRVVGMSWFRIVAKATGGTNPELEAKVTGGGAWRGA